MTHHKHHPERRKHRRFPVLTSLLEPITIKSPDLHIDNPMPGFMGNLSAGGMGIATFIPLPEAKELDITLNIPGFHNEHIQGKVQRVHKKNGSFLIVVTFTKIKKELRDHINRMAEDFEMCLDKRALGVKDICYKKCSYYQLCTEEIKMK